MKRVDVIIRFLFYFWVFNVPINAKKRKLILVFVAGKTWPPEEHADKYLRCGPDQLAHRHVGN